jgi:hypothetical protein
MTTTQYETALARIVKYLKGRGVTVNLNSNAFGYYEEEQLITTPTKAQGTIGMIVGLLHEAGHTKQQQSTFLPLRKSKKRDKAIVTEQEYTAWVEGWSIANQLKIAQEELYITYRKSWLLYWTQYIERLYKVNDVGQLNHIIDSYCTY